MTLHYFLSHYPLKPHLKHILPNVALPATKVEVFILVVVAATEVLDTMVPLTNVVDNSSTGEIIPPTMTLALAICNEFNRTSATCFHCYSTLTPPLFAHLLLVVLLLRFLTGS